MHKRIAVFALLAVSALAACGGGGGSGGGFSPPGGGGAGPTPTPVPTLGPLTVGVAQPGISSIGTVTDPTFGVVGGYTQSTYSQVLAFPVGSSITVRNLATATAHTFNVVSTTGFPANPTLSSAASGGGSIGPTYASGNLAAGGSVTLALTAAGTYYFGCAYHYLSAPQMRDVIEVSNTATPGPQATPAAPAGGGGGGGGCVGIYC